MSTGPSVNGPRLLARLESFGAIGGIANGGVNRQALTQLDRQARAALTQLALARGFEVFQDDIANLFIRRRGRDAGVPPFLIGSHLDTQPTGGRFDGALGTLAALEVLETLEDAAIETDVTIEVVAWTNEEGSRFGPGSMGSQAFSMGAIPGGMLAARSPEGATMANELKSTLEALPEAGRRSIGGAATGYLELHIEQGPILEREGVPLGVVTAVQGTRWLTVTITGEAGHAGTTPLSARRDPMMAAVQGLARLYSALMPGDDDARMTVGRISSEPGSINAIPAEVVFSIDLRHPRIDRLNAMECEIGEALRGAADACKCHIAIERVFDMQPAEFSASLIAAIEHAADLYGVGHRRMVSRAFHDALFVGRVAPAAMLFVPCRDGISHNEKEFVEPEFCVLGAEMLLQATLVAIAALEPLRVAGNA